MRKVWKNTILCLVLVAIFVMPISALKNDDMITEVNITPDDPEFGKQWYLHNTGQNIPESGEGTPDADIDAPETWGIETGKSQVTIAIIDCGIDYTHPDLADNIWINEDEIPGNDIDDDNNGYVDDIRGWNFLDDNNEVKDEAGHGTACAGVVGAVSNNGIGITGVCWNCKIMPVVADDGFDTCPEEAVASGIRYAADNGANVISISIGKNKYSSKWKDAVDYAYNKGAVLVAAAGNDGKSSKSYPCGYENVIAVGATNNTDSKMDVVRWGFIHGKSDYGQWVDVSAPGVDIFTTMPTYEVKFNTLLGLNQNYDYLSGTSFSTPIVSGIAGLLLSHDPTLSAEEVRKIIRANVDPYYSDVYIGTGRVNAFNALNQFNNQPDIPVIPSGKTEGKTGREYTYSSSASDPDGDQLYYVWDWGDRNYSQTLGPFESGEACEATYAWGHDGNYSVRVKAMDMKGGESYWSDPAIVSMPTQVKFNINQLLLQFLENHLHLFPILRQILFYYNVS